ncbi:MAG: GTPase HflX, partial [Oscillospiraceae bacterium]
MPEKAILAAVNCGEYNVENSMKELGALCEAVGMEVGCEIVQNREHPENKYYLGEGKLEEAKQLCQDNDITLCIFDAELTGSQIRNISNFLGIEVIDRTM